jgi:diacylglycerol kinase (ATP)
VPSPFGRLVLIVNPRAGRGQVGREMPALERRIIAGRLDYAVVETERAGHAAELAREALQEGDRFLVAVGGDGTINEVVNGMIEDDRPVADDAVLGAVAAGSGSDFVRTFGLPSAVTTAVRHLLADRLFQIDIGKVTYRQESEERSRYFANIAEVGLGGQMVRRATGLPSFLGRGRRFLGFWLSLAGYRPCEVEVRADRREYRGRAVNVVVANGQFFGGGMRLSPRSYPSDGKLDVQVSIGPRSDAFTMLPQVYQGEHLPHKNIKELKGSEVTVTAERPLRIEADGELLGTTPATFTVLPKAIRLKI